MKGYVRVLDNLTSGNLANLAAFRDAGKLSPGFYPVGGSIQAGSLCYFTPLPCRGGCAEALAGGFPYLARQSGEQSSIGFQPVSSVDYGWLAFLAGPPISACLDEKSKSVGGSIQAGSLCYFTPLPSRGG